MSDSIQNLSDDQRVELLAGHYKAILEILGENPDREGLLKTPMRAAKAMLALTSGYRKSPDTIIKSALFEEEYGSRGQMVVVKDIEFYSFCEHHILPFFGKAHIGYIPNGRVTGLSKLARLVDAFAGAAYGRDMRELAGIARCAGRYCCNRIPPFVYANAGCGEAGCGNDDQFLYGGL